MPYYVIEHPSRGWYTGREYGPFKGAQMWKPHFAWSITARDDRVKKMYSKTEVKTELNKMCKRIKLACKFRVIT